MKKRSKINAVMERKIAKDIDEYISESPPDVQEILKKIRSTIKRRRAGFKDELAAYKGGKGTVQFPLDKKIPYELIARIVIFRMRGLNSSGLYDPYGA